MQRHSMCFKSIDDHVRCKFIECRYQKFAPADILSEQNFTIGNTSRDVASPASRDDDFRPESRVFLKERDVPHSSFYQCCSCHHSCCSSSDYCDTHINMLINQRKLYVFSCILHHKSTIDLLISCVLASRCCGSSLRGENHKVVCKLG